MNARSRDCAQPVAILGAGPIGLACALMLAQRGIASHLVDARSLEQACKDRRLLALSRGTLQMLTGLLGARFAPLAPIHEVHVSSAGEFGAARLSRRDFGAVELGATAWYADLLQALSQAAAKQPRITVHRPRRVVGLEQGSESVRVLLESGDPIPATLAINAEGTAPAAGQPTSVAILAQLEVTGLAPGVAVERFTRLGPLALLPLPQAQASRPEGGGAALPENASQHRSMIWCLQRDAAQERLAIEDCAFVGQVQAMLGSRLGRVIATGPRVPFALVQQRRGRLREHRLVYIGNAAQSLHPVAGQGFNLGMRDCACLADSLAQRPDDSIAALNDYCAARYADRLAISGFTAWLPRAFTSTSTPLNGARSAALLAIDVAAPLRRRLSSLLMFGLRN